MDKYSNNSENAFDKYKKISSNYDNFFDNFINNLSIMLIKFFRILNFTPNYLTTIGNIFGILCIVCLLYKKYYLAVIFYLMRYLFDAMDGLYARTYNMETKFGDNYDHISDYIFFTLTSLIFLLKIDFTYNFAFKIFYIMLSITSAMHLGCIENYFINTKNSNKHLPLLKILCPKKISIHFIKYFGPGTFIIFVCVSLLFLTKK